MRTIRSGAVRLGAAAMSCALAVSLAGCGGSGGGAGDGKLQTVSVGVTGLNASHLWEIVARDQKLMEPYGVNFKLVTFQGVAQILPSLLGGSVNVAVPSVQQSFTAQLKEPRVKMILGTLVGSPISVVGRKGINSPADLKGKKITVNAVGASNDYFAAKAFLAEHGINESDVRFVTGGATSARISAFLSGAVDVVLCAPPDLSKVTAAGHKVLGSPNDIPKVRDSLGYVVVADQSWYQKDRALAVKFVQGYQATQKFMRDPANKDKVVTAIMKALKTDRKAAEETYDYFTKAETGLDPTGAIHLKNLEITLQNAKTDKVPQVSTIDPGSLNKFYDNSLAEEAAKKNGGA